MLSLSKCSLKTNPSSLRNAPTERTYAFLLTVTLLPEVEVAERVG